MPKMRKHQHDTCHRQRIAITGVAHLNCVLSRDTLYQKTALTTASVHSSAKDLYQTRMDISRTSDNPSDYLRRRNSLFSLSPDGRPSKLPTVPARNEVEVAALFAKHPRTRMNPASPQRRNLAICIALLIAATLLTYWPALQNEFINYDDPDYVTTNDVVKKGLTAEGFKWAFTTGHASNWHPITWLSHMADVSMFGMNPMGHHATNLVFHVANTVLL